MKMIKPKAEYSLEIEGETIKSIGVFVRQKVEAPKKPRITPKADYYVDTNKGSQ
jgi:hypothetical protein